MIAQLRAQQGNRQTGLARRVLNLERAPVRVVAQNVIEKPRRRPSGATPESLAYLLLGAFYSDLDSASFCTSEGISIRESALTGVLVEASSGVAGAGFLVALDDFTVDVYDRSGVLSFNFNANSGGSTYTVGVFVAASLTHIYTLGTATATRRLKRFTAAGVFVDELNVTGGTDFVLAGKRDADEVWVGEYLGSGNWKITQYVNMVSGDTFTIDVFALLVSPPENIDIDEDGLMYGLCVRDEDGGWRVIKVNLSDGSASSLVAGADTSYDRLAVGGRDKPASRDASMVYVHFQGDIPSEGYVNIYDAATGSLISTITQSIGTDETYGIARQKVS